MLKVQEFQSLQVLNYHKNFHSSNHIQDELPDSNILFFVLVLPLFHLQDTTDRSHCHTSACIGFQVVVKPNDVAGVAQSHFKVG